MIENKDKSVYDLDYNLTPVMSGGRVDWIFKCNECDHEKTLVNPGHLQHIRAHDHYRGECPIWTLQ